MTTAEMEKMFRVDEATIELQQKTPAEIQRETARTWAGRAIAAYRKYRTCGDLDVRDFATECLHEALEHAALMADGGETVRLIENVVAYEAARLKGGM